MKIILILLVFPISLFSQNIFTSHCDSIKFKMDDIEFGKLANKVFLKLKKSRADTLLFFYQIDVGHTGFIIGKKKEKSFAQLLYQEFPSGKLIVKDLNDSLIREIKIFSIYKQLLISDIKTLDPNYNSSGNEPIFCKIFFKNKFSCFEGLNDNFMRVLSNQDKDFFYDLFVQRYDAMPR